MGTRGFSLGSVVIGAIAAVVILVLVGLGVIYSGSYDVAASSRDGGVLRWVLGSTRAHSIERRAGDLKPPSFTQADIREGGSHFKAMCQECHGGPGAEREEFATAMNPAPPDLSKVANRFSEAEIFWVAKNGIKMTGMPAFGKTDEDEELWKVAAFVKRGLGTMSASEYESLPNAHEHEEGEGGHSH